MPVTIWVMKHSLQRCTSFMPKGPLEVCCLPKKAPSRGCETQIQPKSRWLRNFHTFWHRNKNYYTPPPVNQASHTDTKQQQALHTCVSFLLWLLPLLIIVVRNARTNVFGISNPGRVSLVPLALIRTVGNWSPPQ